MPQAIDTSHKKFGLDQRVIEQINRVLGAFPSVEKAILYGSRAKGNHRLGSDIDLALVGAQLTQQQLSEIDCKLDELDLPYTFDLLCFHEIRNSDLLEHINRVGKIFYPE